MYDCVCPCVCMLMPEVEDGVFLLSDSRWGLSLNWQLTVSARLVSQ